MRHVEERRRGHSKKLAKRPERQFWLRLSLHYRIPVRELQTRLTATEVAELAAFDKYFQPLDDSWRQSAMIASCAFNPHVGKENKIKFETLIPIERVPKDYDPSADIALLNRIYGFE